QEIRDQYMLGDFLLVAPFFAGEKSRKVILPNGKWYDFYTGTLVGENTTITVGQETPDRIPLYVREGGMIPLVAKPLLTPPGQSDNLPLKIRYYGTEPSESRIYDDDGETFAYENRAYSWSK